MEVCALRRFYFSFPVPRLLPRPLLSSLLPKEYGFPTLRRLLWKEYYAHKSSHHSHKTYIDLSTPRQTSTPLEGERVTSVPPSEGEKFPAFYAHLPKVRKGHTAPRAYCSHVFRHITPIPPSEGEKFPAFYAHLPKVGKGHTAPRAYCCHVFRYILPIPPSEGEKFPAFYAHLPKVGKGHTAPRAYCSHVFRRITPIPPSEGEKFPAFYAHLPKVTLHCFPVLLKHYSETPRKYSLSDTILPLDAICYSNLF